MMAKFGSAVLLLVLLSAPAAAAGVGEDERILVTFADPGMSNAARPGPPRPGYVRRGASYLVSVNVRRAANRVAKDFGLEVVDEWPIVALKVHCLVYAIPGDVPVATLLDRLRERPEVESAQRLNTFEVNGAQVQSGADPFARLQHNHDTLELARAHDWSRGAGASVTVIDTGADLKHPELESRISAHRDFVNQRGREFAADAHGTAVAGVIAASAGNGIGVAGVAPEAELVVLKACWYAEGRERAVCDSFTLAKALAHVLESDTHILNLSLGGPPDALLSRLLNLVIEQGIVVVAAAPANGSNGFPANVADVIVVGSNPVAQKAASSARLFAPGDEILVPVPGGGFDYASGTSLSAAQVSGVVALLVARRPGLAIDELVTLLADSHVDNDDFVNACRALASLLQETGCRDTRAANNTPQSDSEGD